MSPHECQNKGIDGYLSGVDQEPYIRMTSYLRPAIDTAASTMEVAMVYISIPLRQSSSIALGWLNRRIQEKPYIPLSLYLRNNRSSNSINKMSEMTKYPWNSGLYPPYKVFYEFYIAMSN